MTKTKLLTPKILFLSLLIPILFFLVSLFTINDYGETTDEKFDQHIGEFYYYQWQEKGVKGLEERFIPLQRNYGPFFDVIVVASNDFFYQKTGLIKNSVASYHFPVIVISAFTVWVVFLFAYLNWGLTPALIASLVLALMPRFIGDSQNNLKDTPLMAFFSFTLLLFYLAETRRKVIYYILAGVFLGLTYTIKINGLIIMPITGLWYLFSRNLVKDLKRLLFFNFFSLLIAFITILMAWPYYSHNTPYRFIETYLTFKNHVWDEYVLYLGQFYRGHEIPWHYPLTMFGVTTPPLYLIFFLIGVIWAVCLVIKNRQPRNIYLLLILWLILPPLTQVVSGAPMYDGIRHFLVSLPPLALIIAFAIWKTGDYLDRIKNGKINLFLTYVVIITIGFLHILFIDIKLHPYQIVYFNSFTGGIKGAYHQFDLDYWGSSLQETAEWINTNLPTGANIWLTIPFAHHFPIDNSRFQLVDNSSADYKVNLIRGMLKTWDPDDNYLYPKRKPIYNLLVDGTPIVQIFPLK